MAVDLSVGQRLSLGFAVAAALLCTLVAAFLLGLSQINEAITAQIGGVGRNERAACRLKEATYLHAISVTDSLLAGGPESLAGYRRSLEHLQESARVMSRLDAAQDQTSADLHRALQAYILQADQIVRARQNSGPSPDMVVLEEALRRQREALIARARAHHDFFHGRIDESRVTILQTVVTLRRDLLLLAGLTLLALLLTAVLTTRAVRGPAQGLVRAVRSLANGDYRAVVHDVDAEPEPAGRPRTRDEMRILTEAFHRMAARLQRRDLRLEADAAVSTALASSLDLETIANAVLHDLARFAAAQFGAVYVKDSIDGQLHAVATSGLDGGREAAAAYLDPVRRALDAGEDLLVEPQGPQPGAAAEPVLVVAPVRGHDDTLGAVLIARRRALAEDCRSFIAASARQLGIGFENALAHLRMQYLADDLQRQTDELKIAHRNKDEFLAVLGHELRNPLAAITYANHVLESERTEGAGKMHRIISRQAARLSRIFEDLLDISRIDRGQLILHKQRVDLADVVRRSVEDILPAFEQAAISLSVHLEERPLAVDADPVRLEQVITNLLHNAAKHVDAGGRVWITGCRRGTELMLSVRDSGHGIAAEHLPRIFDLFVSFSGGPNEGLGVGLALVKKLIELNGGSVAAHSEGPGRGTEILITLPAVPDDVPPPPEPASPAAAGGSQTRLSVLVVEDQPDVAESLAAILTVWGHSVRQASDGPEAMVIALSMKPDVILLDIGLPGMDGYEVMQRLRPQLPATRFVALTGYGQRELSQQAGFDVFLTKPVGMALLEEALIGRSQR